MPYICLTQAVPDGTVQILDLEPNTSLRSASKDAPGQTRYVNRVQNDPVVFSPSLGKTLTAVRGLQAYLLDRVEPSDDVAATATVTATGVQAGDTFTLAGVEFIAVNGNEDPTAQEFDMSGDDDATAASLVAAINDDASQALLTAELGEGLTITAAAVDNVVTLTANTKSRVFLTEGTVESGNGDRLEVSGAYLEKAFQSWTSATLKTVADALIARMDAGNSMTLAAIEAIISATIDDTTIGLGTVQDILEILSGREYYLPAGAQKLSADALPVQVFDPTIRGSFFVNKTLHGTTMTNGIIGPVNIGGDVTAYDRKGIRRIHKSTSFSVSLISGALSKLTGGVVLFPDSGDSPYPARAFPQKTARVVVVYDDDGSVLG